MRQQQVDDQMQQHEGECLQQPRQQRQHLQLQLQQQELGALPQLPRQVLGCELPQEEQQQTLVVAAREGTDQCPFKEQQHQQHGHHAGVAGAGGAAAERRSQCATATEETDPRNRPLQHPGQQAASPQPAAAARSRPAAAGGRESTPLAATQSAPSLCSLEAALLTSGGGVRAAADSSSVPTGVSQPNRSNPLGEQQHLEWEQRWLGQQHPRLLYARSGDPAPQAHTWRCRRCVSSGSVHGAAALAAAAAESGAVLTSCSPTAVRQNEQWQELLQRVAAATAMAAAATPGAAAAGGGTTGSQPGGLSEVAAAAAEATLDTVRAAAVLRQTRSRLLQEEEEPEEGKDEAAGGEESPCRLLSAADDLRCTTSQQPRNTSAAAGPQAAAAFAAGKKTGEVIEEEKADGRASSTGTKAAAAAAKTSGNTDTSGAEICRTSLQPHALAPPSETHRPEKSRAPGVLIGGAHAVPFAAAKSGAPAAAAAACAATGVGAGAALEKLEAEGGARAVAAAAEDRDAGCGGNSPLLAAKNKGEDEGRTVSTSPFSAAVSLSAVTYSSSETPSVTPLGTFPRSTPGAAAGSVEAAEVAAAGPLGAPLAAVAPCGTAETAEAAAALCQAAGIRSAAFAAEALSTVASSAAAAAAAAPVPPPEAAAASVKPYVLIIITGGTICMDYGGERSSMRPQRLARRLQQLPELHDPSIPNFDVLEWETLVDSSDIRVAHWQRLARQVQQFYDAYDGFVILHGTDTMAYTASALSFMLENLAKPVVLTGSMLPMLHIATDAKRNLMASMLIAGCSELREVAVVFGTHVLRGCRVTKFDCAGFDAFVSPNCPPLGVVGIDVIINEEVLLLRQASSFSTAALAAAAGPRCSVSRLPSGPAYAALPPFRPSRATVDLAPDEAAAEAEQGGAASASAAADSGTAVVAGGGERRRERGLSVFCSMAENIVALPLTPYLPMEVLQFLLTRTTPHQNGGGQQHGREAAAAGAAAGQHEKQQARGKAAADKRETEDAATAETTKEKEGEEMKKEKGEEQEKGGAGSPLSVILLLYGSGTAPGSPELLSILQEGIQRGVNVVILSQCRRGCANLLAYENGVQLHNLGVISGKDSTLEACVAKLSYLTGKGYTGKRLKELMEADLRGEITENLNRVGVGSSSSSRAAAAGQTDAGGLFSISEKAETPPLQGLAGILSSTNERSNTCGRYSLSTNTCRSVLNSVDSSRPASCSSGNVRSAPLTRWAACGSFLSASAACPNI